MTSVTPGSVLPFEFETDVDFDGDVDGADFLILQRTNPALIPQWQAEYGQIAPPAISIVPEPTAAVLLLAAAVSYVAARPRSSTLVPRMI